MLKNISFPKESGQTSLTKQEVSNSCRRMSVSLPSERCLEFLVRRAVSPEEEEEAESVKRAVSPDEEEEAASKGHENPSQQHRNVRATFLYTKAVLLQLLHL